MEWASAVKELLYLTLLVDLFLPVGIATSAAPAALLVGIVAWVGKVFVLAIAVTIVESTNAKLRLFRVPNWCRFLWVSRFWRWRSDSCESC